MRTGKEIVTDSSFKLNFRPFSGNNLLKRRMIMKSTRTVEEIVMALAALALDTNHQFVFVGESSKKHYVFKLVSDLNLQKGDMIIGNLDFGGPCLECQKIIKAIIGECEDEDEKEKRFDKFLSDIPKNLGCCYGFNVSALVREVIKD